MTRSLFSIAVSAALVLVSTGAAAHVRFVTPPPRHPTPDREDNTIKTAPCGVENDERTNDETRITEYEPGETITIEFAETIDHPGFFRVSFDDDGQDAFDAPLSRSDVLPNPMLPVLLDDIEDHGIGGYSVRVTLPDIECDNCTLQLIQVMSSAQTWTADEIYYTCADIVLRSSGAGGSSGTGGMGGVAGSASAGAGAGGMAGAGAPPMGGAGSGGAGSGGVSAGSSGTSGGAGSSAGMTSGGAPSGGAGSSAGAGASGSSAMAGTTGAGGGGGVNAAGSAGANAGGATGGSPAAADPASEEAGCGCRTAPAGGGARSLSLVLAALAFLGRRRWRG